MVEFDGLACVVVSSISIGYMAALDASNALPRVLICSSIFFSVNKGNIEGEKKC